MKTLTLLMLLWREAVSQFLKKDGVRGDVHVPKDRQKGPRRELRNCAAVVVSVVVRAIEYSGDSNTMLIKVGGSRRAEGRWRDIADLTLEEREVRF